MYSLETSSRQKYPCDFRPSIMVVFPLPGPPEMTIFLLCLDEEAITYDFSYICIKIARLMLSKENPEEFYSRFHEQLLASQKWPGPYLFKFILRDGETDENVLIKLFDGIKAKFTKKQSSKKTFTSISVMAQIEDPDAVIAIYRKAQQIKGLITL